MRDLIYIIFLSGLILLLFLRPVKENEIFDKGFNEGITSIEQTVARLQDRYDSIKKYSENNVEIQIQKQWLIKHKYDTIYIKLDSLSEDSVHKLFLKIYE